MSYNAAVAVALFRRSPICTNGVAVKEEKQKQDAKREEKRVKGMSQCPVVCRINQRAFPSPPFSSYGLP